MRASGLELDERFLRRGDPVPEPGEADAILSLGGEQSVRQLDRHPELQAEAELLRDAVARGTPVLAVCLGAQLLGHALGGEVFRLDRREVAWRELARLPAAEGDPVFGALPPRVPALHWNEDGVTLPPGAEELLERFGPGVTAYRAGRAAWGVQFHPDADPDLLEGWYALDWAGHAGIDEQAARAADARFEEPQARASAALFGAFARVVLAHADG